MIRMLRRDPSLSVVVIVTLALAIGGNTAVFSVVNGVLLTPLPFQDSHRLVVVSEQTPVRAEMGVAFPDFRDWAARQRSFDDLAASIVIGGVLTGDGDPERVFGRAVTRSFFSTLGARMAAGRAFTAGEDRPGGERVMILSHSLWQRRYGSDPRVLGRSVLYNSEPYMVVGVLPAGFDFYGRDNANNDFFVPLGHLESNEYMRDRDSHPVSVIARVKADVSIDRAAADLSAIAAALAQEYPASNKDVGVRVRTLLDDYVGDTRLALTVLLASAFLVLAVACANIANLLLARASERRREIALRLALGAGRPRVLRQLVAESLLLSTIGGLAGLALGILATRGIDSLSPGTLPRVGEIALDWRVLVFTALVSTLAGIAFGAAPALQATGVDLRRFLSDGSRSSTPAGRRLREALVVAQIALSIALVVGAGLLARSYAAVIRVDPGFNADHVITMRVRLPDGRYRDRAQVLPVLDEVLSRIAALPGVESASLTTGVPLGRANDERYSVDGQADVPRERMPVALTQWVTAEHHRTLGIGLAAGRYFDRRDRVDSGRVAIVDEEFARRTFSGQSPHTALGRRIKLAGEGDRWREIVGVVRHIRHAALDEQPRVQVYAPFEQMEPAWQLEIGRAMDVAVRSSADPASVVAAIRGVLGRIDPEVPLSHVRTLDSAIATSVAPRVLNIALLALFAALALVLCAVGLYGVMSYAVSQRTREIGIRIALGAEPRTVAALVFGRGFRMIAAGAVLGGAAALAAGRLLQGLLYAVTPADPWTFAGAITTIAAVAAAACYLPARRATRLDPLVALRHE